MHITFFLSNFKKQNNEKITQMKNENRSMKLELERLKSLKQSNNESSVLKKLRELEEENKKLKQQLNKQIFNYSNI